jgi:cytochrome P450
MVCTETSAHSLCFAVMLLALYPAVQQRVYEESVRLWPQGVPPLNSSTVCASGPWELLPPNLASALQGIYGKVGKEYP